MGSLEAAILGSVGYVKNNMGAVKIDIQNFAVSGTWTPPPNRGIITLEVELQKGGQGGSSGAVGSSSTPTTTIFATNGGNGGDGVNGSGGGGGGGAGLNPTGAAFTVTGSVMTADQIIAAAGGSGGSLTKVTANVPSGISGVAQWISGTTAAANYTRTYTVTTTATGPIKLYWRRESEANADFTSVSLDGTSVVSGLSGIVMIETITTPSVPAGTHTLTITWNQDSSNSAGINGYWIYGIAHSGGSMSGGPDGVTGLSAVAGGAGGDSSFGMFSTAYIDDTYNATAGSGYLGFASLCYGTKDSGGAGYGTGSDGYNTTIGYGTHRTPFAASGGQGGNSAFSTTNAAGGSAGGPSLTALGGNGGKGGGTAGTAGGSGTLTPTGTNASRGASAGAVTAGTNVATATVDGVSGSPGSIGPTGHGSGGGGGGGGEGLSNGVSSGGAPGNGMKRSRIDATDVYAFASSVPVTVGIGGTGGQAAVGPATGKHSGNGGNGGNGFVRVVTVYIPA